MMHNISWNDEPGDIILNYDGNKDGIVHIQSDVNTNTQSRSLTLYLKDTKNTVLTSITINQTACPFNIDQNYTFYKSIQNRFFLVDLYILQNSNVTMFNLGLNFTGENDRLNVFCIKGISSGKVYYRTRNILSGARYILEFDENYVKVLDIQITSSDYSEQELDIVPNHYYIVTFSYGVLYCKSQELIATEYPFDVLFDNSPSLQGISDESKLIDCYLNSSGNSIELTDYTTSDIIQIPENITLVRTETGNGAYHSFYDENYNYISSSKNTGIISIPQNAKYIQYCSHNSSPRRGVFAINYTPPTYNWDFTEEISPEQSGTSGKYINNLSKAVVGSSWTPAYTSLSGYSSFAYRVYKNSYFRLRGKTGSGTLWLILTDLQGKVVLKISYSASKYIKGVNISTDGYIYGSMQTSNTIGGSALIIQYRNDS